MNPSAVSEDVLKLRTALKEIHTAATRVRETTDVQTRMQQLVSSFEVFNRRVLKRGVDKEVLEDDWRLIRGQHLSYIETMIRYAERNAGGEAVAVAELKRVLEAAQELENNLRADNRGSLEANCSTLLGEIRAAQRVCDQLNQNELTKIWFISSSLLGKASE
jgi:hypothetical protein